MIMYNDWSSMYICIEHTMNTIDTEYTYTSDNSYTYIRIYAIE